MILIRPQIPTCVYPRVLHSEGEQAQVQKQVRHSCKRVQRNRKEQIKSSFSTMLGAILLVFVVSASLGASAFALAEGPNPRPGTTESAKRKQGLVSYVALWSSSEGDRAVCDGGRWLFSMAGIYHCMLCSLCPCCKCDADTCVCESHN